MDRIISPSGIRARDTIQIMRSIERSRHLLLFCMYYQKMLSTPAIVNERNRMIRDRYAAGETKTNLACEFELSHQHVQQIVNKGKR